MDFRLLLVVVLTLALLYVVYKMVNYGKKHPHVWEQEHKHVYKLIDAFCDGDSSGGFETDLLYKCECGDYQVETIDGAWFKYEGELVAYSAVVMQEAKREAIERAKKEKKESTPQSAPESQESQEQK